jgi:PKD repeat protein
MVQTQTPRTTTAWLCAALLALQTPGQGATDNRTVECWDIFEISLAGPSSGNPFLGVHLSAEFRQAERVFTPAGFYDGDGVYKIRFMPDAPGPWTYVTRSNWQELDGKKGAFTCVAAAPGNHGPVRVRDTFRLTYADGTPHFSVGTTCYAWAHQGDAMEEQTLATLKNAPFNKMRMCVFPKSYAYNRNEPRYYPYEGKPPKDWDFTRFNPAFWRHFEKRVGQLRDLGIEADIIIFHPYDRWGFKSMGHESNLFYLRYLVARLAAYRNVWWSFANEYDLLKWPMEHWDRYMQLVQEIDPYDHLRGIHNCRTWYDHSRPWVTHCSIQNSDFRRAKEYRDRYRKPVVYDECRYEGDIPQGWGNITAEQMTRNFWMGSLAGCYVGHGETYKHPEDLLWWSKGGVLRGRSPARIQFLKDILEDLPYQEMSPDFSHHPAVCILAKPGDSYLMYFPEKTPVTLDLPGDRPYKLDAIEPWEMTVLPVGSAGPGPFRFTPPKPDYAIRLTRYAPGEQIRPTAQAAADKTEGIAPLTVRFSTPWKQQCCWDFGDSSGSTENAPAHTFDRPGIYTVTLTVTDSDGASGSATLSISVDRRSDQPIVRFGFAAGDQPPVALHGGQVAKVVGGGYDLGTEAPFSWITVGAGPIADLEGARSFTVMGWLKAGAMQVGAGGNRILFSLQHNRSGIDIVHHADGRMRLAVNEWPDNIQNDSSPGRVRIGTWVFFAVTYDAAQQHDSVCWYFGDESTPAVLDCRTDYNNGPVGAGSGDVVIGNFNRTLQSAGLDRQFRGQIRGLQIYASRIGTRGALPLALIRQRQKDR